jgi:hypothetical protein
LLIEIATFRLAPGVADGDFVDLDARVQTEFVYQQRGCVRRTTGRAPDGEWLALTFWNSMRDAEAAEKAGESDPLWREFIDAVNGYTVRRYTSLD